MGILGNSNRTLIRHDFKRALYRAFLSEFPPEKIREYFSLVALEIDGKVLRESELINLLWEPKGQIPIWWDVATDNVLERFLVGEGKTVAGIMKKVLWLNNNSSIMPGKVLLSWFYPKLESLFSSLDSRDVAFALMTLHNEKWVPGSFHRRIQKREENGWIHSVIMLILDRTHREYLDWDMEPFAVPMLMSIPCLLGMPPLEKSGMLADTRPPERIVWRPEDVPVWKGERLEIGGRDYGHRILFGGFWRRLGLDLDRFDPPDIPVVEIERDYVCPVRGRTVLHAGCVYGAPFYLHTTAHRKLKYIAKSPLLSMVDDLTREEETKEDELEGKHAALMASLNPPAIYRYHGSDESLTLNDRYFTKGIPAKIMKGLLDAYLSEGKREFEYRDFKRRFEINLGQKNANFEVRFARLAEKLDTEQGGVRIEKTGRGRFRLQITGVVEFQGAEEG